MAQNWNNIINYVKANLGTKHSSIEITDDEFVNYFKEQTLSYFSQIIPLQYWTLLTNANIVATPAMFSEYTYKIDLPEDIILIDVESVYISDRNSLETMSAIGSPADTVMNNTFNDMVQFLSTVNDYQFIKPYYLRFSESVNISTFIIELNIEHTSPATIPGDMYHKLFKSMCLLDAFELVLNNRNKYNNLTTPFGQIELNIDYIQQRIQEIRQKNEDMIEQLPHREYLEIF